MTVTGQSLVVLGSTGSIGVNTLDIVRRNPDRFRIHGLAAGRNTQVLLAQILEFKPEVVVVADEAARQRLRTSLTNSRLPELLTGQQALVDIATAPEVDTVMSAIVGVAGLEATYEAARAGKRIALANKEVLVTAGKLVMDAVARSGADLIPVDSEHNGAHQCLRVGNRSQVRRLILTASGGPFRNTPCHELPFVTPEQALNHPTWRMGNRVTIDSATLMNKGFEVIEACWLFGFRPSEIDVVIHPQSSVHAMIEYSDGSLIAQISATDMRMPIQYALTWPQRDETPVPRMDWSTARTWEFSPPDYGKFPLLKLAYEAVETGGSATCTLNAADEVAVQAFLDGGISFPKIVEVVERTLSKVPVSQPQTIGDVLEADERSRALARELASQMGAHACAPATA